MPILPDEYLHKNSNGTLDVDLTHHPLIRSWAVTGEIEIAPLNSDRRKQFCNSLQYQASRLGYMLDTKFSTTPEIWDCALSIVKMRAILAPIRLLPFELLAQVFLASNPILPNNWDDLRSCMQVCRTWRECAKAFPELWSRLDVSNRTRDNKSYSPLNFNGIQLSLSRSKNAKLQIAYHDPIFYNSDFMLLLRGCLPQTSVLQFHDVTFTEYMQCNFFRHLQHSPNLVELRLINLNLRSYPPILLPHLRHLMLKSVFDIQLLFDCPSLISLSLIDAELSARMLIDLISHSTSFETLTLTRTEVSDVGAQVTKANLVRNLIVGGLCQPMHSESVFFVLEELSNLSSLEMSLPLTLPVSPLQISSLAWTTHLQLRFAYFFPEVKDHIFLRDLLTKATSVTQLSIIVEPYFSKCREEVSFVLSLLVSRMETDYIPLCPNLTSLSIEGAFVDKDVLLRFSRERSFSRNNALSKHSENQSNKGDCLVTLINCPGLPTLWSRNCDQLHDRLEQIISV